MTPPWVDSNGFISLVSRRRSKPVVTVPSSLSRWKSEFGVSDATELISIANDGMSPWREQKKMEEDGIKGTQGYQANV